MNIVYMICIILNLCVGGGVCLYVGGCELDINAYFVYDGLVWDMFVIIICMSSGYH